MTPNNSDPMVRQIARNNPQESLRGGRSAKGNPSHDEIRLRAYQIFEARGGSPGNEVDDWTQAERELRRKN